MRAIRCFWYHSDGAPLITHRGHGCLRKDSCRFTHPWDADWLTAVDERIPQRGRTSRKDRSISSTRSYSSSRSPSPRSRSRSRDHSTRRGPSPPTTYNRRTRSRSGSSSRRGRSFSRGRSTPAPATAPASPGPSTSDAGKLMDDSQSPPSIPVVKPREKRMSTPTAPRALRALSTPVAVAPKPASGETFLQSGLPVQPAVPPPPLPPAPPLDEVSDPSVSVRDLPKQEGDDETVWMSRIKLLSEATKSRRELQQIEAELSRYKAFASTCQLDELHETGALALRKGLADLKLRKVENTSKLQEAIRRLASSGDAIFPTSKEHVTAPCAPTRIDLSDVVELKKSMSQLQLALVGIASRSGNTDCSSGSICRESSQVSAAITPTGDDSDVDMLDANESDSPSAPSRSEPSPLLDLDALQTSLAEFEERISALETNSDQQHQDWQDDTDALIQDRARDLQDELQQRGSPLDATAQVIRVETECKSIGDDLTDIANEVAELIRDHGNLVEVNSQLNAENEELRRLLAETQTENRSQLDAMQDETRALTEMMTRLQQNPCHAEYHRLCGLSGAALSDQLRPHLEATLRQQVEPLISDVTQAMEMLMKRHREELTNNVMPKVTIAVQVAKTIERWIRNSAAITPGYAASPLNASFVQGRR